MRKRCAICLHAQEFHTEALKQTFKSAKNTYTHANAWMCVHAHTHTYTYIDTITHSYIATTHIHVHTKLHKHTYTHTHTTLYRCVDKMSYLTIATIYIFVIFF